MQRRTGPTLEGFLAGGALALAGLFQLHNADAFGHLAQGRAIAAAGRVPQFDPFSIWQAEPQPWHNYEWLYDLLSWGTYVLGGPTGLVLMKCLILFYIGHMLVGINWNFAKGESWALSLTVVLVTFVIPAARFRLTARPQIIGLLFAVILILLCHQLMVKERTRFPWGTLLGLGAMHVLWVNMHGSHLLGVAIVAVYAVSAWGTFPFRYFVTLLAFQVLASGCSPYGFAIVTDAVEHVFQPEYRAIVTEWEPWSDKYPLYWLIAPVIQSVLLLIALRPMLRTGRAGVAASILCVLFTLMAFRSIRFTAHQLLLTSPFIAYGLASYLKGKRTRDVGKWFVVGFTAAVLYAIWLSPKLPPLVRVDTDINEKGTPWSSYRYLAGAKQPKIFAGARESWVALFALPGAKVLIDGRVPFYGAEYTQKATQALTEPEVFQALVEPSEVDTVIIDHVMPPYQSVLKSLLATPHWRLEHIEDQHVVFRRVDPRGSKPRFRLFVPSYDPAPLLDKRARRDDIRRDREALGGDKNGRAVQTWTDALLQLRQYARDGANAGFRAPENDAERKDFAQATTLLTRAALRFPGLPNIELYRGLAALGACDLKTAQAALDAASLYGSKREVGLAKLELELRSDGAGVEEALKQQSQSPESKSDPWLRAIERDMAAKVRCVPAPPA